MKRIALVVLAALLAASSLLAQDKKEEKKKPAEFTGDFSFVKTGGNSDLVTLGLGDKFEYRFASPFTFKQEFSWVYGKTDGVESANQLLAGLRGEYGLSRRVNLYAGANYDYNLFAGVKRHFEEYAGVGFLAVDAPKDKLRFDVGLSVNQEWAPLEENATNFTAGQLVGDYKHLFTEKAYFQEIVTFLPNFTFSSDYRLNSETALVAPLVNRIAIKLGYIVKYRGEPPEGFKKTDTLFRTGIQITF